MTFRIFRKEVENDLLPAIDFFNAIPDHRFVEVVNFLSKGIGYTIEYCSCDFSDDLYPWEEPFEGIRFVNSALDIESILDYKIVQELLRESSHSFLKERPEYMDIINQSLFDFSQKYNLIFKKLYF